MQLKDVYDLLCEIYDAAHEFIEIYIIENYDEYVVNNIERNDS